MKLKSTLFLIIVNLCIPLLIFGQNTPNCWELIKKSNVEYNSKNYQEALVLFQKATECTKELRKDEYYNGACIASLAKNERLALDYLKIAINKGWENVEHMGTDTDLDFIRQTKKYTQLILQLNQRYDYLNKHFKGLQPSDLPFAIPFAINNKWGWLHKETKKVLVKPTLSYTDFKYSKGLIFEDSNASFTLSNDLKVSKNPESWQRNEVPVMAYYPNEAKIIADENFKGFTITNKKIAAYSNKYIKIDFIEGMNWGIVKRREDSLFGIIKENGDIVKGFDFEYTQISLFQYHSSLPNFICKKKNKNEYELYNSEGVKAMEDSFENFEYISNFQFPPNNKSIYIGGVGYNLFKVKINNTYNIYNKWKLKPIFTKSYEDIVMANGPTNDSNRTGFNGGDGLTDIYFLVKEGNNYFYVDTYGVEYKPK
jgi:hypothetical protein